MCCGTSRTYIPAPCHKLNPPRTERIERLHPNVFSPSSGRMVQSLVESQLYQKSKTEKTRKYQHRTTSISVCLPLTAGAVSRLENKFYGVERGLEALAVALPQCKRVAANERLCVYAISNIHSPGGCFLSCSSRTGKKPLDQKQTESHCLSTRANVSEAISSRVMKTIRYLDCGEREMDGSISFFRRQPIQATLGSMLSHECCSEIRYSAIEHTFLFELFSASPFARDRGFLADLFATIGFQEP